MHPKSNFFVARLFNSNTLTRFPIFITVSDLFQIWQVQAGPTVVGSYGSVLFESKNGDTKFSFKATETTIQNLRGLNGCVLSVQKPYGNHQPPIHIHSPPLLHLQVQNFENRDVRIEESATL